MADDHKTKLERFFSLVPKSNAMTQRNNISGAEYYGEVQSGSPIIPITSKADLPEIKKKIEAAKIIDNSTFKALTDLTHTELLNNWKNGGLLTSCNGFVKKAGEAAGVQGLGGFNVEAAMQGLHKHHCWIPVQSGEKPQFGDVFETRSRDPKKGYENLHVGITLSVAGDDWYTIQGGQGGPGSGVDKVARVKTKYDTAHLLGWVDMRLLASGVGPMPDWLLGTWMIYSGNQIYVYSFNRYFEVTQEPYRPVPAQNGGAPRLDKGKLLSVSGDDIKLSWDCEGGVESFTYDRWNSFSGINERMNGAAADGSSMSGVRL